jgi:hypothetical protein
LRATPHPLPDDHAVTLIGVAVVVFFVIRVVPGDPIAMMLPPGASDEDIDRLRALYGLDKSIFEQFWIWVGGILQGDFGTSISLAAAGDAGWCWGGCPQRWNWRPSRLSSPGARRALAVLGTLRRATRTETAVDLWNGVTLSIPDFLWGLILILLFGVLIPVFHGLGPDLAALNLPIRDQFYAVRKPVRLRLRSLVGSRHTCSCRPWRWPCRWRRSSPAAQAVAEGNHASRLRDAVAHQGLWRKRM